MADPLYLPLEGEEMEEMIAKINLEIFYSESTPFEFPLFWRGFGVRFWLRAVEH
jgi:hypothetical protein